MDIHHWTIELLAYWEGRVNSTDITNHFGLSSTQAKSYLGSYQELFPQNLHYDNKKKCFTPAPDFTHQFISTEVSEYLDWIANQTNNSLLNAPDYKQITHTSLSVPHRSVSPSIMRSLVAAVKQHRRVDAEYVSMSTPQNEGRIIQPHTFVKTGLRWHLRAYCEAKQDFRDFVLSRFRGDLTDMGDATHKEGDDPHWNTSIDLIFVPNQRLTTHQKTIVEQDYNMQNGQLVVPTKAALAQYVIQEMQVSTKFFDITPEAQQLVLGNLVDVKPYLF